MVSSITAKASEIIGNKVLVSGPTGVDYLLHKSEF